MKPRTRLQKEIAGLSHTLPQLTKAQRAYAFRHCFIHRGYKSAKDIITCSECGHSWKSESHLADTLCGCTCPHCGMQLMVELTRKRKFVENQYFSIITTCQAYQVMRYFSVKSVCRKGESAKYYITEVVQRWIAPNGKSETIARLRGMSVYYYDLWDMGSDMEIRKNNQHRAYDITPTCVYPRKRIIPEILRNGFKGKCHGINAFDLFTAILSDCKAETLLKAEQFALLKDYIHSYYNMNKYWASVKICIRNGYNISDASIWRDMIDQLQYFGKDTNNPKFVCPADLHTEHDQWLQKRNIIREREREAEQRNWERERIAREQKKLEQMEDDKKAYINSKANFLNLMFTDGLLIIRVLQNVDEFYKEGEALHHCVFSNSYYNRENSLILSARIDGKRIETIEVSLKTFKVVQSRGINNSNTAYHDRIINLVNSNMDQIRQRMAKAA